MFTKSHHWTTFRASRSPFKTSQCTSLGSILILCSNVRPGLTDKAITGTRFYYIYPHINKFGDTSVTFLITYLLRSKIKKKYSWSLSWAWCEGGGGMELHEATNGGFAVSGSHDLLSARSPTIVSFNNCVLHLWESLSVSENSIFYNR